MFFGNLKLFMHDADLIINASLSISIPLQLSLSIFPSGEFSDRKASKNRLQSRYICMCTTWLFIPSSSSCFFEQAKFTNKTLTQIKKKTFTFSRRRRANCNPPKLNSAPASMPGINFGNLKRDRFRPLVPKEETFPKPTSLLH